MKHHQFKLSVKAHGPLLGFTLIYSCDVTPLSKVLIHFHECHVWVTNVVFLCTDLLFFSCTNPLLLCMACWEENEVNKMVKRAIFT